MTATKCPGVALLLISRKTWGECHSIESGAPVEERADILVHHPPPHHQHVAFRLPHPLKPELVASLQDSAGVPIPGFSENYHISEADLLSRDQGAVSTVTLGSKVFTSNGNVYAFIGAMVSFSMTHDNDGGSHETRLVLLLPTC